MRREWIGCLCLLTLLGAAVALAADDAGQDDGGPSLEYRPPKPILPEPKGPTPAPPVPIFRQSFGGFGIGRGSFDGPRDVAVGAEGRTYVLDSGNSRVQLFDKSDNFILEWGDDGTDEKRCQFKSPTGVFVLPQVRVPCRNKDWTECEVVLVLDSGNQRIQWFKVPITSNPREKLPNFPCGHKESVFYRYSSVFSSSRRPGDVAGDFGDWGDYGISDTAKFNRPLDIAFEGDGVLGRRGDVLMFRVLDAGNARIQRFEITFDNDNGFNLPPTNLSEDTISDRTGVRGDLEDLVSLAWSNEESFDYLYLLGKGCSVQKFKYSTSVTSRSAANQSSNLPLPVLDTTWPAVAPESGLCVPERIRYDPEKEYVYVLDAGNSILSIFHRSGNFISALQGADRRFDEPGGFDFVPGTGEFVVADTGNNLVQKFTLR